MQTIYPTLIAAALGAWVVLLLVSTERARRATSAPPHSPEQAPAALRSGGGKASATAKTSH